MSTKFKKIVNAATNAVEYQFGAELVSVNTKTPQSYTNASGEEKVYYLGTVNFTAPDGTEQKGVTTQIYAKSFDKGMKVGNVLLSTLSQVKNADGSVAMFIRTSHLPANSTIDTAAFAGLDFDAIEAEVAEPIAAVV